MSDVEGKLLHEMFREQAAKTPNAPAVSDGVRTISYGELDKLSDRMAYWLQQQGCGMECIGVIYMNKQIEYIIAYAAILKANAAYLPMDVAYPPDLIDMVLQDAKPKAIITTPEYVERSGSRFGDIPYFVCGTDWETQLPDERISPERPEGMTWENMAYTVYSSGTTGKPKGIVCPHRGAVLSYNYRHVQYPYFEGEREAANVFLVWECFRPLLKGAHLFVVPDNIIYDVDALPAFIERNAIDRMMFTPSLLDAVLSNPEVQPKRLQTLKLIIYCGEVVTVALRNKCRELLPACRLHNLYSISECHDCTGSDLTSDASLDLKRPYCPVGKLLPQVGVLVLDDNMEEVPPGVQGEIFITGPYLARGYLGRPELTAQRFVERHGVRMYRTGDFGYLIRDGELEICGRCDSMVKVRGYSIELLAVQKALLEMKDMVSDAIVMAHGEAAATEKTLVAYVILPADKQTEQQSKLRKQLRTSLKRRLPFYMVPTYIEFMVGFPSTAIGKVDKKALPSLASIQEKQGFDTDNMPTTAGEVKVAKVMQKILGLSSDKLDIGEGFFDLGGNSLLTIPLLKELSAAFDGRKIVLDDIFVYPSIAELAAYLSKPPGEKAGPEASEKRDLASEVLAYSGPPDISMNTRAFWRHAEVQKMYRSHRVLLTGATGFLGAFLLSEFLRSTRSYVYCLVRVANVGGGGVSPAQACRNRVVKTLQGYGLYTEDIEKALQERLDVLVGDAGLQNMGLDDDEYHYLSQHVDTVVHAAALVNLIYPYDALVAGNVRGTANMVSFCQTGKVKAMHYVSSDAVFPLKGNGTPWGERDNLGESWTELHSGYAQSKWVAEQIVRKALDCGLPGAIYRCGNIAGHSTTGAWNGKDSNLSIIRACLLAQAVPVVDNLSLTIEATPVDFIAMFLVSCAENIRGSTNKTYHLIQPNHLDMAGLLEATKRAGYTNIRAVDSVEEWVNLVEVASAAAGVQPVTEETLLEICQLQDRAFSNDNVAAWLTKLTKMGHIQSTHASTEHIVGMYLPHRYPTVNSVMMARYLTKLTTTWKVLPPPTAVEVSPETKALHMRVVVVTGATSPIGAAITLKLAQNGARVACLDTDTEKLEQIAKEAALCGGIVQPVPVDLCDIAAVRAGVERAESELGAPAWGLVNCNSKMFAEPVSAGNAESWGMMLDANCKSVLNATGAVMDSLTSGAKSRGGHIINLTSDSSHYPFKGLAAYSATKHFLEAWSRGLRQEVAPLGIRVTNIQPGNIRSEMKMRYGAEAERVFANVSGNSLGAAEPPSTSDVAEAVLYAMTSRNSICFNDIMVEPSFPCSDGY